MDQKASTKFEELGMYVGPKAEYISCHNLSLFEQTYHTRYIYNNPVYKKPGLEMPKI